MMARVQEEDDRRAAGLGADFAKLWAGQTVSAFGTWVSRIALPLTALSLLGSDALEQGYLRVAEALPALALSLVAGVWVDRLRRRPVMIAADLGRAIVIATVPAAALAGRLTMAHLYAVTAIVSALSVFFDAAYPAYLPTLVGRGRVVEGNAKLAASAAVAETAGFPLGGALVQFLSAPAALLVDAASFVASALSILIVRTPEPPPLPSNRREGFRREVADGLRAVSHDPLLRALVATTTLLGLAGGAFGALYFVYTVGELGLPPTLVGAVIACGGVGSFLGGAFGARVVARLGLGRTLALALGAHALFLALTPLARGPLPLVAAALGAAQLAGDFCLTLFFVYETSLRQAVVSDALLGRVSAVSALLSGVAVPAGAVAGGLAGNAFGARAALWLACGGMALPFLRLLLSPVRSLDRMPQGSN